MIAVAGGVRRRIAVQLACVLLASGGAALSAWSLHRPGPLTPLQKALLAPAWPGVSAALVSRASSPATLGFVSAFVAWWALAFGLSAAVCQAYGRTRRRPEVKSPRDGAHPRNVRVRLYAGVGVFLMIWLAGAWMLSRPWNVD